MGQSISAKLKENLTAAFRWSIALCSKIDNTRYFWPILYAALGILVFMWGWTFLHARLGSHFSQDSWEYYLIGKNIFSGLGYTSFSARDLSVPPIWPVVSKSFPPLHPLLVGLVDVVSGLGMRSASFVSLLYLAGSIAAMFFFTRELDRRSWLIPFFGFILFYGTNQWYREELEAGRSIPGMMMFFFLALLFFLKTLSDEQRRQRHGVLVGLFLSAMLLQRFDQTLFVLGFLFLSFFIYKIRGLSTRDSLVITGVIAAALFAGSLPWAIRNIIQFGAPFASDNTGSVTSTFGGLYCNSFWLPGKEAATIFTNPHLWLDQRTKYLIRNFNTVVTISQPVIYVVPIVILALWRTFSLPQRVYLVLALTSCLATLFTISLTPYGDTRYFSLVHLNLCVVLAMGISNAFRTSSTRIINAALQILLVAVLMINTFSKENWKNLRTDLLHGHIIPNNLADTRATYAQLSKKLDKYMKPDDILSLKPHCERYTYFTGRRTVYYPSTTGGNHKAIIKWIEVWGVDYFLIPMTQIRQLRLDKFVVTQVDKRGLVDCAAFVKSSNARAKKPLKTHLGKKKT